MGTFYTDGSEQVQLAKLNYLCFTGAKYIHTQVQHPTGHYWHHHTKRYKELDVSAKKWNITTRQNWDDLRTREAQIRSMYKVNIHSRLLADIQKAACAWKNDRFINKTPGILCKSQLVPLFLMTCGARTSSHRGDCGLR